MLCPRNLAGQSPRRCYGRWTGTTLSPEYVAGFFDGEGCVHFFKDKPHSMEITFSNTHRGVLEDIRTALGGIGAIRWQRQRENWSVRYVLRIRRLADVDRALCFFGDECVVKMSDIAEARRRIADFQSRLDVAKEKHRRVAALIASGMRYRDVAREVGYSERTVYNLRGGRK